MAYGIYAITVIYLYDFFPSFRHTYLHNNGILYIGRLCIFLHAGGLS